MSKIKTIAPAPKPIQNFIRRATNAQRIGFLVKGDPQCVRLQTMKDGDFVHVYYPSLRGVIVGKEADSPESAIALAAERRSAFLLEEREDVNEEALGIDTEGYDLMNRFSDIGCRLESIFHIGTMITDGDMLPHEFEEMIDDLSPTDDSLLLEDLPFLKQMLKDANEHDIQPQEIIAESCHDHGEFGFIVSVSIPEHRPLGDGSATVHMSIRHVGCRYASTFKVACERALEWAEAERDRMLAKPIAA